MDIQTFRAGSLQEALQLVRQSLGPDASIIDTRQVRPGRLSMFGKRQVEVDAALEIADVSTLLSDRRAAESSLASATPLSRKDVRGELRSLPAAEAQKPARIAVKGMPPERATVAELRAEVPPSAELCLAIDRGAIGDYGGVRAALLERGFPGSLVSQLVHDVSGRLQNDQSDPQLVTGQIHQMLAQDLHCGGAVETAKGTQAVLAVVGPTGAGKTTTLAKIAATCRFELGLEVGLMTLDTFRQGAVDQLLYYAEMVSAALEVVSSLDHVAAARKRLASCDIILIDTAGRPPQAADQLAVLSDLLRAAQPQATHLVLSGSSSARFARRALERFSVVQPTHLILTKLDEAVDFGSWQPLLTESRLPVSYLTSGQHIPRDISVATARRLASCLLDDLAMDLANQ